MSICGGGFEVDFGTPRAPSEVQNHWKRWEGWLKSKVDVFAPERLRGRFWEPKWSQNWSQKQRKIDAKINAKIDYENHEILLILELVLGSFWEPFLLKFSSRFSHRFLLWKNAPDCKKTEWVDEMRGPGLEDLGGSWIESAAHCFSSQDVAC